MLSDKKTIYWKQEILLNSDIFAKNMEIALKVLWVFLIASSYNIKIYSCNTENVLCNSHNTNHIIYVLEISWKWQKVRK